MRRVLFYTISLSCAVAINLALIGLLILASPKNQNPLDYKLPPTEFNLSQNNTSISNTTHVEQLKALALEQESIPQRSTTVLQQRQGPSLTHAFESPESAEEQFERDHFFSRGQQILASLEETAPKKTTTEQKITTLDCLNRNKTHCYCSKTLGHIGTFYTALRKKKARSLAQWYEQPNTKPDVTVHVAKNGSLKSIQMTKSSGSSMHDKLFVQAIKEAAPFPKIPDHFNVNELIFEL